MIEIYSGNHCGYCHRGKLRQRGYEFSEYDVQADPARREGMNRRVNGGARTIPQIFIHGRHVGGCDELCALDRQNKLSEWVVG